MLIRIQVTIGKKKVTFSFFMKISPGSLPKPGTFEPKIKIKPIIDKIIPKIKSNFPISVII
ncbi:MAG: hypothetical protein H6Q47_188, partial [Deltaproteobacteria bacterium]|nr:hypothetical protein [Deltaproteobacteria bacterium]